MKSAITACLAIVVALAFSAAAMADRLPEAGSGGGQPLITGDLHSESPHGVIHCQPVAEIISGEEAKAPGAIVVNPNGIKADAPPGGACEEIEELIFG